MAALSTCPPLTRPSVVAAHELIKPHVHLTPVLTNTTLSQLASTPQALEGTRWAATAGAGVAKEPAKPVIRLWFKCENLQRIGAFKARGAFHAVERLKKDEKWVEEGGMEKGVVSHSSGMSWCFAYLTFSRLDLFGLLRSRINGLLWSDDHGQGGRPPWTDDTAHCEGKLMIVQLNPHQNPCANKHPQETMQQPSPSPRERAVSQHTLSCPRSPPPPRSPRQRATAPT